MFLETLESRSLLATITAGAGPGGFESFATASSLAFWVDASDIDGNGAPDALANGSAITNWADKSGFGRNLANTGTVSYTLASAAGNNKPAVAFSNSRLQSAYDFDALGADYSIIGVSRYTGGDNERVISSATGNWLFGHWGGGDQRWYAEGWIEQSGAAPTTFSIYTGIIGPSVPNADFWKNGTQLKDNAGGYNGGDYKPGRLELGSYLNGNETSNAEVSELLIINRKINEAERLSILNALSAKYNLAIGAQDAYLGDDVGNGDYDLNVFGIGRLNATNQLLSAGQAGFGIEATSIADDGDFIGAGHKLVTNTFTAAGVPAGVTRRFSRAWVVQVNDTNDNLGATLAFDYSDAGLAIGTASTFKLLRSLDGGTSWTDVGATATQAGDLITFNVSAAQLSTALYTLGDASGPQLAMTAGNTPYSIGGAPVAVDGSLTLAAGGSPTMTGATVSINGFVGGNSDVLAFTPIGAITGVYSSATGVLTLSGTDTAANYQQALRSVTFTKPSYQATPSRTLTYSVTDSAAFTSTGTRGIIINANAAATDIFWDGNSDGDGDSVSWTDPNNWSTGIVPDSNDTAVFQNNDPGLVSWVGDIIVGGVRFANTAGIPYSLNGTGGTLSLTNGNVAQTGSISNSLDVNTIITSPAAAITFTIANGTTLTANNQISGTGDLVKNGAGTVLLAAGNTYTGNTLINAGTLKIAGAAVVPPVPSGAVLEYTFDGGNANNTGTSGAANNGNLLSGANVVGGGLFGNRMNTPYGARMELPALPLGTNWTMSAWWQNLHGTGDWRTLFRNNGGGDDHGIIVQQGTNNLGMYDNATGGGFRDSGFDLLPAADNVWHNLVAVGNDITNTTTIYIDGVLVGTSDRASAGNLYWIGGLNTSQTYANYLDEIRVYQTNLTPAQIADLYNNGAGIPTLGSANAIPDTSNVTVAAGATFDLNSIPEVIGALNGPGTVTSSIAGTPKLTVGANNASGNFSGVIQNGAGTVSLAKVGTGNQTLTGANTFTGTTAVENGILSLASGTNRLPATTVVTLGAGANSGILDLGGESQTVAGLISSSSSSRVVNSSPIFGTITINTASGTNTYSGILGMAGQDNFSLVKSGAGTQVLTAANTFTGTTVVDGGVLQINSDAALGTAPGALATAHLTISNNSVLRNSATFTLNANRGILLGAGGGQVETNAGTALTIAAPFIGAAGLTKIGTGDLILSNTGTLSAIGTLNINAGRVFFHSQNSLGTGTINIANGGTLDYLTGGALSLSNVVNIASGGNIASRPAQLTVPNAVLPTTGTIIVNQDDQNTNTVVLPQNIALTGPLTIQVGGGGGNGGVAQFSGVISGSAAVTKTQNGVLLLSNGGNSFSGALNATAGTVRVSASGALGTVAGPTNVSSGATLDFNGAFNYTTAEQLNIAGTGVGLAGAINKTGGNGSIDTPIKLTGNALIGSAAGSLLTINPNVDLSFSHLTFVGAGNIQVNGNLQAGAIPTNSVANLNSLASGSYTFTAGGQTFNARVDNVAGTGWLLIGRGRQGWEFDTDGQGTPASVETGIGTSAAFTPAAFSDAIVTDLLLQSGFNASQVEMRMRRATDAPGTTYQEARWRNFPANWTLQFSNPGVDTNSGGFGITYEVVSTGGIVGATTGVSAGANTRDFEFGGNDGDRVFTWGWSGHGGQRGFSYGSAVNLAAGPSPTNFLWESGGENHEIPYTEIYIRSLTPAVLVPNNITKNGTGTVTLAGNNTYAGTTTVNAGTLIAASNSALGTNAGATSVYGGTLGFSNNVITSEAITAAGAGGAGQPGALVNVSGSNTLNGNITGTGTELRIGSTAGTLTINGNINMTNTSLNFDGAGNVIVAGNISQGAGLQLNGVRAELEIWLDASDPNADGSAVANGTTITNWQDRSGNDRDFNSFNSDPSFVLAGTHGQPAINFDGDDFLRTNNTNNNPRNFIDGNGEFTLITVARYSGADRERVIGAGYNGHNWLFGFHGNSTNRNGHYDAWGSLDPAPIGNTTDTNWHLHANQMNVFSDATNPAGDWWRDGLRLTDDSRGTADSFNNNVPDGLEVGGYNGLGEASTAEVSELLMYNRVLTDTELNLVQSYLNAKYSLGFPMATIPAATIGKFGTGTVTLSGNNTFAAAATVSAGTLVAASTTALGTAAGGTTVNNSGTLGVSGNIAIAGEPIQISGLGASGMPGALVNISGSNSITATASVAATDSAQQIGIGSVAGTLTIDAGVNLKFARLITDGAGNVTINGAIGSVLPGPSLATLNNFATGTYSVTVAGQTFPVYVNNDGTSSWMLIGRGREGWEFDTDGQQAPTAVSTNVGTAAGFAPAALSNAIVNGLLAQSGINNTNAQFRIRRATDTTGTTPFQEYRWSNFASPTFTFNLDNAGAGIATTAQVFASSLNAAAGPAAGQTRDFDLLGSNGAGRIFTWAWGGHNNSRGFSYGAAVNNGTNAAGSFLWEFANEEHAIPYAEIYIRSTGAQVTQDNSIIKNGTGTTTLGGANTYTGTTTINAGMLVAANNTALGTIGVGTTVAPGAALGFAGNVAVVAEPVTVQAVNGNTQDSIVNVSGTNTFAGTITLATLSTASSTSVAAFTGGDPGEGLDLTGTFPYAINVLGPAVGPVQGVNFTTSESGGTPGLTFSAPNNILNYTNPNYGATTNDNNLEVVMQSIRWNTGPVTFDLAGLVVGNVYKVQLLFSDAYASPSRFFNVSTEGAIIVPNFTSGSLTSNQVITRTYQAADTILNISLNPGSGPDTNPIISGITVEDLGPAPRQDLNIRSDAGSLTLASGLALDGSVLTLKGAGNLTLNGNITQGGASQLVKTGTGAATLAGTNTYSGNTSINGGTLVVQNGNAILNTAGPVSAAVGATLQLLNNETVSSFVGAGDFGAGTNDSTLALGNNVLTATSGAAIANVTSTATGGIIVSTAITDADDDNNITGTGIFLQAGTGIGTSVDPIETTITNFEAVTATGGVFISNTGALNIGGVSAALSGVDVTGASGAISLAATGTINIVLHDEDVLGPQNITINAQGVTSNLNTGGANSGFGSVIRSTGVGAVVSLAAGQDITLGTTAFGDYGDVASPGSVLITAGRDFTIQQFTFLDVNSSGTSTINAGRDITLFADGAFSRITTQGGVISLTANRNISVGSDGTSATIDSTQNGTVAAGANINLTATTGSITIRDAINAGTAGNLVLNAVAGAITDTNLNGTTRIRGVNLTANSATGVTLETTVATATSVTATGVGNISLNETDSLNLVTTTAANGTLTINSGALTNAASAVVSASGAANLTAPSIALGNQAGDTVNFGTLTFSSTGAVTIQENSGLDLLGTNTATGAISLQSVDGAAAGQNLNLPAGSTLTSTGSSILLNAGDDATLAGNISASTTITVNIDSGNADAAGAAVVSSGVLTAPGGAIFSGDTNNDTFTISPSTSAAITVNGNAPTVAPGDTLNLNLTGVLSPILSLGSPGAGSWSFAPPHQAVVYSSIEDVNVVGATFYDLILNANLATFGNTGVADDVTIRRSGPDLIVERTGALNMPNDPVGPIFQGDMANILSFTYVGSGDNDRVTVSDSGGMLDFLASVPGVPNNPNLAGTAEFLFNGNGGTDALIYNYTGANAALSYAIGNGSGAAGLEGEVASTSGATTLLSYFQNVELLQATGSGATPGTANVIGDSSANVVTISANGGLTNTSIPGYTPFEFSGNNFSGLVINAGAGGDTLDLVSLGSGQISPLPITLNGEGDADTLRVQSTSGNTGTVTLNGGAASDAFQLYNSANTVNSILGQVIVDGTDGNVAANNDTLTIIDTGDTTADNVTIAAVNPGSSADYRIDGINGTAIDDVIFRNIDTLTYTGTQGNDTLDTQLVNTVPQHDLSVVTINGWLGGDQFLLFTSDQAGGTSPTPTGVASGVAIINLNGDAPGNPNGLDGNDVFGQTGPGIVGTGANNAGQVVPDTVHGIRPSVSSAININGGEPTGPAVPTGDTVGDVINLDLSGLPTTTALVLPTASGIVPVAGYSPLNYAQIEDMNLIINNTLINVQMGDTFVRGTSGQDLIQFMQNSRPGVDPNSARVRVNLLVVDFVLTGKSYTVAGAANDYITQSNILNPAEMYGEGGDDYISGGEGNDFIVGGLGNDQENAGGGDNVLYGDNAPTTADPNPQNLAIGGNDILSALNGNDVFYGGGGDDSFSAGGGNDYMNGGMGNDTLGGAEGDDRLYGGPGDDVLGGGSGHDLLSGGDGQDQLFGNTGNDVLLAGNGADILDAGAGSDLLVSGSTANENSTWSSVASTTTFGSNTYSNISDNDAALLTLLSQWAVSNNRSTLGIITHDSQNDDLYGGTGDDDFCWESADIADNPPALNPSDYNTLGMGTDERFGPT